MFVLYKEFLITLAEVLADADVVKVIETKKGHDIKLTAEDSKHCDDYLWEHKELVV